MRGKQRFNTPANTFNSNGDGTYTFEAVAATSGAGWITTATPIWNFDWSVNTDYDGSSGPMNWQLQVARFVAPVMAAGTVLQTASVVFTVNTAGAPGT